MTTTLHRTITKSPSSPSRSFKRMAGCFTAAAALVATVGCNSKITGNEGNFQFSYAADDQIADFNKPIAVGATLEVSVTEVGSNNPVTLSTASFDKPEVLEVDSFSSNVVIIRGTGDGEALLSVEGTGADGELLPDSVNFLSRIPEVMKLSHSCTDDAAGAYLTGNRVFVAFDLEMDNGQPVIGKGVYPATASDTAAFAVNTGASTQRHIAFDVGAAAATLTLDSDIDTTSLNVTVAPESAIDGVLPPVDFAGEDIDVGDKAAFFVLPSIGGVAVCQSTANKTITSLTPDTCAVRDRDAEASSLESGWFEVEGLAAGTCEYTVTYPEGNAGAGASETFTYTIEP